MLLQQCYEDYLQFNEHGRTSLKQLSAATANTHGNDGDQRWRCPIHKTNGHSFHDYKTYKHMQAKLQKAQRGAKKQRRTSRTPPICDKDKDKGKDCHYRNKLGHITKNCRKRKADEAATAKL